MEAWALFLMTLWFAFVIALLSGGGYLVYRVLEHNNWI